MKGKLYWGIVYEEGNKGTGSSIISGFCSENNTK